MERIKRFDIFSSEGLRRYPGGWLGGCCSAFAVALQNRFGGELWAIANHSRKYPKDDYLIHAYCVIDGWAYDAGGRHCLSKVSDTSDCSVDGMDVGDDVVIQWKKVDIRWFERNHEDYGFGMSSIKNAYAYIDGHPKLFKGLICSIHPPI